MECLGQKLQAPSSYPPSLGLARSSCTDIASDRRDIPKSQDLESNQELDSSRARCCRLTCLECFPGLAVDLLQALVTEPDLAAVTIVTVLLASLRGGGHRRSLVCQIQLGKLS